MKNIPCEFTAINLLTDEPEQPSHLDRNPMGQVPVLEVTGKQKSPWLLTESMAILEWLEETYPTPSLFSGDSYQRAKIRQLAEIINSGTQPLQNPSVVERVTLDPAEQKKWNQRWIRRGLQAFESLAQTTSGKFSVGDSITLADLLLIPQCYNSIRNEVSLQEFPTIERIYRVALEQESCRKSAPDQFQP